MKKNIFAVTVMILIFTVAVILGGCEKNETQAPGKSDAATAETASMTDTEGNDPADGGETADSSGEKEQYTARDLAQTADLSGARNIALTDDETINITEAGVYVLTGSAKNTCIVVQAGDDDKVQLVLDGIIIINTDRPCILVENADKVFLTSVQDSENVFTVSGKFGGDEDAAVFSRDDLTMNGLGTVTVSSSKDGIRTNDDMRITGGTWIIEASGSALKAHDSIYASDGEYHLTAEKDGIHAEDNDNDTTGCIVIEGGKFTIQAGDDGIHATTGVTVNGGDITISAAEGIEATQVTINDGNVSIRAADDGINAGRKSKSLEVRIEINGGDITIVMGSGDTDAIDSNGNLVITGGRIDITGQSAFDFDGSCSYTGGTIIVNGTEINSITNQMAGGGMMGGHMGGKPNGHGGK